MLDHILAPSVCPLGDTPQANWLWSQKGMIGIIMPFCWVIPCLFEIGVLSWWKTQCTMKSFRAPGFLKLFLPISLRCALPHLVLTYGNTLGTKPAILNQPILHHIQFPSYDGQVMKHVFIIGSGWMGSEVQHSSPELLISSCVCKQEHTDKPAHLNLEVNSTLHCLLT